MEPDDEHHQEARVTVRYSCTFEFDRRPPVTHRGTVTASSGATCVARATREAQRAIRPVGWSSLVVVLLERLDVALETEADAAPELARGGGIAEARGKRQEASVEKNTKKTYLPALPARSLTVRP